MIPLTRLNGDKVAINPDRIERADITPDVVLTMADGSKFVVAESLDELIDRIRLFRASVPRSPTASFSRATTLPARATCASCAAARRARWWTPTRSSRPLGR